MKCITFIGVLLSLCLILSSLSLASVQYNVIQLTDNSYNDRFPKINDQGQLVWTRGWNEEREIFFYDGSRVIQLTDNSYADHSPQINNNGYVVWQGWDGTDYEIYLYDGSTITQITENDYSDKYPQINDNGFVVWQGWDGSDSEIFLYDGTTTIQITDNIYFDGNPQINENGDIVWWAEDGSRDTAEIFFYDGSTITQITNNTILDWYPMLNNNGQITWMGCGSEDYCDIYFYDGQDVILIWAPWYPWTSEYPQINDLGQIVWTDYYNGYGGPLWMVYLYDGSYPPTELKGSYENNADPHINNNGYVTWYGWDTGKEGIFLYDGTSIQEIASFSSSALRTLSAPGDYGPHLNNNGYIVWEGWNLSGAGMLEIFLAVPIPVWGTASVAGLNAQPDAGALNYLLILIVPFGVLILWRVVGR